MVIFSLCDGLHLPYSELAKQPMWWVLGMKEFLTGKEMAMAEKNKAKNKTPDISKYKIPRIRR